jgi:hypothetical protein
VGVWGFETLPEPEGEEVEEEGEEDFSFLLKAVPAPRTETKKNVEVSGG